MTLFWKNILLQNTNNNLSARFYYQLENFVVGNAQLKEPATHRIFPAWVEDLKEEAIHKGCCVSEGRLLNKYKDLAFCDPDDEVTRTVYSRNLTYVKKFRGKKGLRSGWVLLGTHPDDDNDDKIQLFIISDFVVDFISDTQQGAGAKVVQLAYEGRGKEGDGKDTGDILIRGETYMV